MFQSPTPTSAPSTARRSTRVSRSSIASINASKQHQPYKRKNKRRSDAHAAAISHSDVLISLRRNIASGPARKYAKVLRAPSLNAGFKTMKWVAVGDLTFDEKVAWNEEQTRNKGKVLTAPKEKKEEEGVIIHPNTDGSKNNAQEKETILESILKIDPGGQDRNESREEMKNSQTSTSNFDKQAGDPEHDINVKVEAATPIQEDAHTEPHTDIFKENVKMEESK